MGQHVLLLCDILKITFADEECSMPRQTKKWIPVLGYSWHILIVLVSSVVPILFITEGWKKSVLNFIFVMQFYYLFTTIQYDYIPSLKPGNN